MGLHKKLSSDSRDGMPIDLSQFKSPGITGSEFVRTGSTPDPENFKVIQRVSINSFPIYWVKYPGVENYEGNKILMYPKCFNEDLIKERMDPHFFTIGDSPIARFEPTQYGWNLAIKLAQNL